MTGQALARTLSVLGHPAVLMPAAAVGYAVNQGAASALVQTAAAVSLAFAVAVLGYGAWRVRAGHWVHADASRPAERQQLNVFMVIGLLAITGVASAHGPSRPLAAGAALCAAVVAVALLLRPWLKLSLHAAFAALATALWWPSHAVLACMALLTCGVGWSRLKLGRHTPAEVVLGAAVGGLAGAAFHLLIAWWS